MCTVCVGQSGKGEHGSSSAALLKASHSAEEFAELCRKGIKGKEEESNSEDMMLLPKCYPWKCTGLFNPPG